MLSKIRLFVAFTLLITSLGVMADEGKSFSRQMNEIKRSGDYVYAESSAPNENDAKTACDALLKIEITKYLISVDTQSQTDGRIIKNISDYKREYLIQPRGDMIRVFGYVTKSSISYDKKNSTINITPPTENKEVEQTTPEVEKEAEQTAVEVEETIESLPAADEKINLPSTSTTVSLPEKSVGEVPVDESVSQLPDNKLKTEGLQLAKWQIDMLENIVKESDMIQAKKRLNRYKFQNRIKRLGDNSATNPRPTDSFYLIYDNTSKPPVALLAPSSTDMHYDMLSGATINLNNYISNQYYWFQISQ